MEDIHNLTQQPHIEVPISSKAQYVLLDIDEESGFLSLLTGDGETKEDSALCRAIDEDGQPTEEFDEVGQEIIKRFNDGDSLRVTILSIMGKDLPVGWTIDVS